MKRLLFLSFVLILNTLYGAKSLPDLKLELKNASTIEEEVHAVINIAYMFSRTIPDSGLAYGQIGLQKALENKLKYEEARANSAIGINHFVKSEYKLALSHQIKALQQYEALDSTEQVAGANANISLIFKNQSDYRKAMEYALKALTKYNEIGEVKNKAIVLENIGTLFFRQGQNDKATEYYQRAYVIYESEKDSIGIARNKGNMGMVLSGVGKYEGANAAFKEALYLNKILGNRRSVQVNYGNMGLLEFRMKNYKKALSYYDSSQVETKVLGAKLAYAANLGNIGEVYVEMAKQNGATVDLKVLDEGINYLQEGIMGCLELQSADPALGFYPKLSEAYALKGDYKSALEAGKKGGQLKDSIHSVANRISVENMEAVHNLAIVAHDLKAKNQELKIKKLELSKARQQLALYLMGFAILILVGAVAVYFMRKYKRKSKMLAESNELYATKIEEQLASLTKHATVLDEITYMQAHHVREPVATILGMVEHFNMDNPNDPMNIFIMENLHRVSEQLDVAVREVINKKDEVKEA